MAGNSIEETTGMLTAMVEITQSAGKSSRGLRQTITRMTQMLDETSSNGQKLKQIYSDLNIEVTDSEGNLRSTYDILSDLSEVWDTLSSNEQQYIALTSSGSNQIQNFTALMNNFSHATDATTTALSSAGSAEQENEKYLTSISAKANLLKSELQELVLGNGGLSDLIKLLLDATTVLLKFANSGVGKAIIATTALVVVCNALGKLMKTDLVTGITDVITHLARLIVNENLATSVGYVLLGVLGEISAMEKSTAIGLIVSTVALLAVGIGKLTDKLIVTREEAQESYDEAMGQLNDARSKIEELNQQLDELDDKEATLTDPNDIANLEIERQQLEAQLEIQKQQYETAKRQAQLEAERVANANVVYASFGKNGEGTPFDESGKIITGKTLQGDAKTALAEQTETITALTAKIAELTQARAKLGDMDAILAKNESDLTEQERAKLDEYNEINDAISRNSATLQANQDSSVKNAQALQQLIDSHTDLNGKVDETVSAEQDVLNAWTDSNKGARGVTSALKEQGDTAVLTEQDIEGLSEGLDENAGSAEDVAKAYDSAVNSISSMSDEFGTLNNAVSEYNSTGGLSLDTISDLLSLDNEYLSLLQLENGQMSVNTDMANSLVNAKINMAEATAVEKAQTELAQVQNNEYQSTLAQSANASSIAVESARQAGQAILESGQDADIAGEKWANAWSKISQGKVFKGSQKAQAKEIENSLKSQIVTLESLRKNIGSVTSSTKSNTSSKKKNTDATKANTDALKKNLEVLKEHKQELDNQKKAYDDVISYIENKIKTAIDNIEDERDKILDNLKDDFDDLKDNIDKQKQALEDAKDADTEYWQAKIDALKDANDELESQIELQELLDSLERAKATKKMVYREGQGFVYEADSEAVSVAQKNLQEYYRKKAYEDELKQLQDYLKGLQDGYDKRIKDLDNFIKAEEERYKKQVEDTKKKYEDLIKPLQDYLDKFKKGVDAYENEQNRQKALFLTGIDFEKDGWETRLKNLEGFLERYKALQAQITEATRQVTEAQRLYNEASSASGGSGSTGGGGGYSSGNSSPKNNYINNGQDLSIEQINYLINGAKGELKKPNATAKEIKSRVDIQYNAGKLTTSQRKQIYDVIDWYDAQRYARHDSRVANRHADGIYSTKDDEIAIVGDDPQFSELVVGSKLNSGAKILNSSKGTGVIPHNLTSTLVSMAQAFQGQQPLQTTNNSTATTISIGNINLPNVENGEQFVDYLQHFNLDMTNLAYSR